MAPMEGITGYIYRKAYHKCFGNMDRYFAPFIMSRRLNQKEIRDILPENNEGMELIPQILTNRAEDFLAIAKEIVELHGGMIRAKSDDISTQFIVTLPGKADEEGVTDEIYTHRRYTFGGKSGRRKRR